MSEQKRYTAHEMREVERKIRNGLSWFDGSNIPEIRKTMKGSDCDAAWRMLRQAADAEEELDALRKATKVEVHLDGAEVNAALARMVDEMRECLKEAVGFFDRLSEGIEVDKGFLTMCNKWRKAMEGAKDGK